MTDKMSVICASRQTNKHQKKKKKKKKKKVLYL